MQTRTPSAGYSLASYALFAGLPDGWKTPSTRIGVGPVFSRQCSWSGGRWMHEPGPIGVSLPAEVEDALALDDVDDLVVVVAVQRRAARRDHADELGDVEAAEILVDEEAELAVRRRGQASRSA